MTVQDNGVRRSLHDIDGAAVPVTLSGSMTGRTIILLEDTAHKAATRGALQERLQIAMFRVVSVPLQDGLSAKSIVRFLDELQIASGVIVGDGVGGDLAWDLAAGHHGRFNGLVAINCGHPAVPNVNGVIRDGSCPAVEVDTTILAGGRSAHAVARASRRHVRADFRLVDVAGPRSSQHFTIQLATEIVMRALSH